MRSEKLGQLQFHSHQVPGVVGILLTALVTANVQKTIDGGGRGVRIGFAERDLVPEEKIMPPVKPVVLANDDPDILSIEAHPCPPKPHY